MQSLQTLRGSNQTDELDVLGTALLDLADGVAGARTNQDLGTE